MTNIEIAFKEITARFAKEAHRAIKESVLDIECEILPHVDDDTYSNVQCGVNEAIGKLARGAFTSSSDGDVLSVSVSGFGAVVRIDSSVWNDATKLIASIVKDDVKDIRISQLESELKMLRDDQNNFIS